MGVTKNGFETHGTKEISSRRPLHRSVVWRRPEACYCKCGSAHGIKSDCAHAWRDKTCKTCGALKAEHDAWLAL